MKIFLYSLSVILVITLFSTLLYLMSFSFFKSFTEKGSPFECGFQALSGLSIPFSMPFFVVSLMFLLFDVEILLLCFYPMMSGTSVYFSFETSILITMILTATIYEWANGVISWF